MKRIHRTSHHAIWRGLAVMLPLLILIAVVIRVEQLGDAAPVQLAPPQSGEAVSP